jgi:hypothetical protein
MRFSIGGLMGFVVIVALGFGGLKAASPLWASACYSLAFVALIAGVLLAIQLRGRHRAFCVGFSVTGWAYFAMVFVLAGFSSSEFEPPPFLTGILFQEGQALFFPQNNSVVTATYPAAFPVTTPVPPIPAVPPSPATAQPPTDSDDEPSTAAPKPLPIQPFNATQPPPTPPIQVSGTLTGSVMSGTPKPNANVTVSTTTFTTTYTPGAVAVPPMLSSTPPEICFEQIGQSMATLLFASIGGLFSLILAARRERNEANPASTPEVSPPSP